jgi:hypothetical protein
MLGRGREEGVAEAPGLDSEWQPIELGGTAMAFTALFIAHAPDADPEKHRAVVETGLYRLFTVVVRDTEQAVQVCRKMVADEGVDSVLLCPGNTHEDVAAIAAEVGNQVSVSVARGDAPSMRVAAKAMENAGWFAARPRA